MLLRFRTARRRRLLLSGLDPALRRALEADARFLARLTPSDRSNTIAMARVGRDVGEVKAADSATSQFFINTVDNTKLDKKEDPRGIGYCVFGRVIEGMDVVDKIEKVKKKPTDDPMDTPSVPVQDVVIKSVKRADKK